MSKITKKKVKVKKKVKKNLKTIVTKVKKKVKAKVKASKSSAPKKRGRPCKKKVEGVLKVKKKRGRPVGQKNKTFKIKSYTECDDYILPKTYKFLGYCPNGCDNIISTKDLAKGTKTIYVCELCGRRGKISKLKQERIIENSSSKKEYI